jgi:hypothetical protein
VKLLLALLLGAVVVGLVFPRMDARTYAAVAAGTLFTTSLFFFMERFWL